MPSEYQIAFWNTENLFDVENSPRRSEKLHRAIGADIRGWTQALLQRKIEQLGSTIRKIRQAQGRICSECAKLRTNT